jgi:hypothetical protein
MERVVAGQPSKNIAADLGISRRTVENHRAEIMKRTGTKCLAALARLSMGAGRTDQLDPLDQLLEIIGTEPAEIFDEERIGSPAAAHPQQHAVARSRPVVAALTSRRRDEDPPPDCRDHARNVGGPS